MKYLLVGLLICFSILGKAQTPNQKLSNDSVRYYQRELNQLWKDTYDTLKNSERYKYLQNKIDPKNRRKNVTVELLANIGLYVNDFKNLNSRIKSIGYEEIKTTSPSVGASLAIGYPIMTYGIELSGYVFDNKSSSFKGIHGRVFIATNLFKKGRFALSPQIGYAGSFLNMFIHKSQGQTNFNDLFISQANTIQLIHSTNYLDVGLGLKLKSFTKESFYWQFLRAGYRYGLKDATWRMRGGKLINAPTDRNNQFYIQFCLGFEK